MVAIGKLLGLGTANTHYKTKVALLDCHQVIHQDDKLFEANLSMAVSRILPEVPCSTLQSAPEDFLTVIKGTLFQHDEEKLSAAFD